MIRGLFMDGQGKLYTITTTLPVIKVHSYSFIKGIANGPLRLYRDKRLVGEILSHQPFEIKGEKELIQLLGTQDEDWVRTVDLMELNVDLRASLGATEIVGNIFYPDDPDALDEPYVSYQGQITGLPSGITPIVQIQGLAMPTLGPGEPTHLLHERTLPAGVPPPNIAFSGFAPLSRVYDFAANGENPQFRRLGAVGVRMRVVVGLGGPAGDTVRFSACRLNWGPLRKYFPFNQGRIRVRLQTDGTVSSVASLGA